MSNRNRFILLLACILAPFVYTWALDWWRNISPFGPPGPFHVLALTYAVASSIEAIGALIAAIVLSVPVAWVIRSHPLLIATFLSLAASLTVLPDLIFIAAQLDWWFPAAIQIPSLIAFFFSCWMIAKLVVWNRTRNVAM